MNKEQLAQWVIDNRYPKGENDKVTDSEMYHFIVDALSPQPMDTAPKDGIEILVRDGEGKWYIGKWYQKNVGYYHSSGMLRIVYPQCWRPL